MTKTFETVAREFAEEIKSTIVKALPVKTTNLGVRLSEKDGRGRVVLETSEPIELSCDNRPLLYLAIKYHFTLNGTHSFLKVESSSFCVLPSKSGNPLFRYEYLDAPSDSTPSAHLHVHGHRDEIVKRCMYPNDPDRIEPKAQMRVKRGWWTPKRSSISPNFISLWEGRARAVRRIAG